jgi:hypothetical protein
LRWRKLKKQVDGNKMEPYFEDQVFLLSSRDAIPEVMFHGYGFVGADYVFGQGGAERWEEQNDALIAPGEDGCYAIARRHGRGLRIGTDFSGNKKVFYYHDPRIWAVSNSVYVLAAYLKSQKIALVPNYAQLLVAGHGRGSSFFNQLSTFDTIVAGIRLLPRGWELIVDRTTIELRPQNPMPASSYEEGLRKFIARWVARLGTLVALEDASVSCDLTGGQDSRAIFSLLRRSIDLSAGANARLRINCGVPASGDRRDIEVAEMICAKVGMPLNGAIPRSGRAISGEQSYKSWRDLCLGVYWPVYFPSGRPWPHRISIGGGGGGNNRIFYSMDRVQSFLDGISRKTPSAWVVEQYRRELDGAMSTLDVVDASDAPGLVKHYRNFRGRCHAGRGPQYAVEFCPLASADLQRACDAPGASERIQHGIVNYDIIHNAASDLLELRFDSRKKDVTPERRSLLKDLDLSFEVAAGHAYIEQDPAEPAAKGGSSPLECLRDDYHAAVSRSEVASFWGADVLDAASRSLDEAVEKRRFNHAVDGQPIAAVIATSIF